MRSWVEYLILNQSAYNDFISYIDDIEKTLNSSIYNSLLKDEKEEATLTAVELKAYKTIAKKVKASFVERQAQINYNENLK